MLSLEVKQELLAVAENGLRWSKNILVEINNNQIRSVNNEAADEVRTAISHLENAASLLRQTQLQKEKK